MSEFTPLREAVDTLASRTPTPDFGELTRRATRRGRRRVVMVAAATAAVIAVGGAMAARTLDVSGQLSPIGEPTTPSSEMPTVQESAESPDCSYREASDCSDAFNMEVDAILGQVPGWAVNKELPDDTALDFVIGGPCEGNWLRGATGAGHGIAGAAGLVKGLFHAGWPSEAHASDAAARLVENLASCNKTAWRTQQTARPGAVLASSAQAVVWIQQTRTDVWVLQVLSTDGPPPSGVQVEVAEWMVDYITWQNEWTGP